MITNEDMEAMKDTEEETINVVDPNGLQVLFDRMKGIQEDAQIVQNILMMGYIVSLGQGWSKEEVLESLNASWRPATEIVNKFLTKGEENA
jgi:hypothetical protein